MHKIKPSTLTAEAVILKEQVKGFLQVTTYFHL